MAILTQEDYRSGKLQNTLDKSMPTDTFIDDGVGYFNPEISAIMDMHTLKALYFNEAWVYIATNAVAKKIARSPLVVSKEILLNGKLVKKPLESHSLMQKLYRPNDYEGYTKFMTKLGIELTLMGNCIIWRQRFHKQLLILPTELVTIQYDMNGAVDYYQINVGSTEDYAGMLQGNFKILPDDIIHISLPNPNSLLWGLSPFIPGRKSILFERYSTEYLLNFYLKQANPGPVIEMGEKANENQAMRFLKSMEMRFTGRKNQRRTLILPKGVTAKNLSNTLAEQQLKEHIVLKQQDIRSLLQIPPHEFGIQSTGSIGSEETDKQTKNFYQSTIIPFQTLIADELTLAYEKDLGRNSFVEYDNSRVEVLQDNEKVRAEVSEKHMLWKTVNEVRRDYDLKPLPDGDVIVALIPPAQQNPYGNFSKPEAPQLPSGEVINIEESFSPEKKQLRGFLKENFGWWEKRQKQEEDILLENEKDVLISTLDMFANQAPLAVKAFMEVFGKKLKADGYENDKQDLNDKLDDAFSSFKEVWVNENVPTLQTTSELGYDTQLNVPFNLPSQNEIEALRIRNERGRRAINEARGIKAFETFTITTTDQIQKLIETGIDSSQTLDEIARDIIKYFGQAAPNRAKTIARTETLIAVSLGQEAAFRDANEIIPGMKKKWISAHDNRVRDSHEALDGTEIKADEFFKSNLAFPRDPRSTAEEIINCRCTMLMIPPE